jgi:hypothetical protein
MNDFQGRLWSGNGGASLRVKSDAHGKSFPVKPYLLE